MSRSKRNRWKVPASQGSGNPKPKGGRRAPPLPPETAEDDIEISEEDIGFVNENIAYAAFLQNLDKRKLDKAVMGEKDSPRVSKKSKIETDPEEYYEKNLKNSSEGKTKTGFLVDSVDALPIKTEDGDLVYRKSEIDLTERPESDLSEPEESPKSNDREEMKYIESKSEKTDGIHLPLSSELNAAVSEVSAEERRDNLRLKIAEIGSTILSDPETNLRLIEELQVLSRDDDVEVASLALLSICSVFKDVVPGYRIRPPTLKELEMSVSKEVRKLRDYESLLLKQYEAYLTHLIRLSKISKYNRVSMRCLCALFSSISHFNFRERLLSAIIPKMASMDDNISSMCCSTVGGVIRNGTPDDGNITLECVQLIADLVKKRNCVARPEVIQVFFYLSFDENLEPSSGVQPVKVKKSFKRSKSSANASESNSSTLQSKKQWKREKKKLTSEVKRQVKADFRLAAAAPDAVERRKTQSSILSAVFETYFRVLKTSLNPPLITEEYLSVSARYGIQPLLSTSLKGLAKFSHLISVEFMGDLLTMLRKLGSSCGSMSPLEIESRMFESSPVSLSHENSGTELDLSQRLRCCVVAFHILRSNLYALNVDLREFYTHFYSMLYEAPIDARCGPDFAEALQAMLWEVRQPDLQRTSAFIKRLGTISIHLNSASSITSLGVIMNLLSKSPKCKIMLENDLGGALQGVSAAAFDYTSTDPELSGSLSSCLWDLSLLGQHYHPHVSKLANEVAKMEESSSKLPLVAASDRKPVSIFSKYDTSASAFYPDIPTHVQAKISRVKSYEKEFCSEFLNAIHTPNGLPVGRCTKGEMNNPPHSSVNDMIEQVEETIEKEISLNNLFSTQFRNSKAFTENEHLRRQVRSITNKVNRIKQHLSTYEEKLLLHSKKPRKGKTERNKPKIGKISQSTKRNKVLRKGLKNIE